MMTIEGHQTGSTVPMHMDMPEKVKKSGHGHRAKR